MRSMFLSGVSDQVQILTRVFFTLTALLPALAACLRQIAPGPVWLEHDHNC